MPCDGGVSMMICRLVFATEDSKRCGRSIPVFFHAILFFCGSRLWIVRCISFCMRRSECDVLQMFDFQNVGNVDHPDGFVIAIYDRELADLSRDHDIHRVAQTRSGLDSRKGFGHPLGDGAIEVLILSLLHQLRQIAIGENPFENTVCIHQHDRTRSTAWFGGVDQDLADGVRGKREATLRLRTHGFVHARQSFS